MNYILSSVILLVITIIIIYLFSIDNNIDKFKNKLNATFNTIKSNQINYLNEFDLSLLLHFLKLHYTQYNNIMIPRRVFYLLDKKNNVYILQNIQIIGFKLHNDVFIETNHTVTIKFIPIKNELFVGRYTLFGKNGNYYIEDDISQINKSDIKPRKKTTMSSQQTDAKELTTDVLDMIPDIIHLSSDI